MKWVSVGYEKKKGVAEIYSFWMFWGIYYFALHLLETVYSDLCSRPHISDSHSCLPLISTLLTFRVNLGNLG